MPETKPQPRPVEANDETPISIAKPGDFSLDKFKSKRSPTMAGVETLLAALPHHNSSQAKDSVRLHPNEGEYWSPELCFVNVPIKGQKHETLHLIDEELAMRYLPSGRIQRFRLALASKPQDVFFLCHVPSRNLDNKWNDTSMRACVQAKTIGRRRPAAGQKASMATRSAAPRIRTPFPNRNGRRR